MVPTLPDAPIICPANPRICHKSFCTCSVGRDYHTVSPLRMCCNRRPRKQGDAVMLKNRTLKTWSIILTGSLVAVGVSLFIFSTRSARAAGGTLIARSQLRRTTDPSPRGPVGSVVAMIDANGKETFQVDVTKLGEANFGPFLRIEPSFTTNAVASLALAPLNRTNVKKGTWSRKYTGTGGAPADILPFFDDLTELN